MVYSTRAIQPILEVHPTLGYDSGGRLEVRQVSDRVAPIVPLIFPCEFATLDLADEKWQLKQPLHFVRLPDDKSFPFRVDEFWLYAQLMYGLGEFNLSVQLIEQESGIIVGRSEVIQRLFDARNRWKAIEEVFRLRGMVFPRSGIYELRLIGNHQVLPGGVSVLRVQ